MRLILVVILIAVSYSQSILSDRFHTYDEVLSQLLEWETKFADSSHVRYNNKKIYKLIEIGKSTNEQLPFWVVKLTYDADNELSDKPKVLILGQCHAEEILGVEISMAIIDNFLNPTSDQDYREINLGDMRKILENTEIWIVPTHNPEGLSVVHGWQEGQNWLQDVSFRKNKTDVNQNSIFDFIVGVGNDSDGVDLNRNYDFNWFFGDNAYENDPGGCNSAYLSHFDYYKGDAPFSESEVQVIRDLALSNKFLLSIAYHSSRSGCVSEKVIYSWAWGDSTKFAPDVDVIHNFGKDIAGQIRKDNANGITYDATISKSRKGNAHDWFYTQTGCIQYLIEAGSADMQPDSEQKINEIIVENLRGAYLLMNRAAGNKYGNFGTDINQISGIVTDKTSSNPINAEVIVMEMSGGILKPRYTDGFGRYRRLLHEGSYSIIARAIGYESDTSIVTSSSSIVINNDIVLTPLEMDSVYVDLSLYGTYISSANLIIPHVNGIIDTVLLNPGENSFLYPEGVYSAILEGEDKLPVYFDLEVNDNQNFDLSLYDQSFKYVENFENLGSWTIESGNWVIENGKLLSQNDQLYFNNLNSSIFAYKSEGFADLDSQINYAFIIDMMYELEWDYDTLFIQLYNQDSVIASRKWHDQKWEDRSYYINIPMGTASIDKIQISLSSDMAVNYRGVSIDQMGIIEGAGTLLKNNIAKPISFELFPNYPNPFNPNTNISFSLDQPGNINLSVFNLKGEKVSELIKNEWRPAGKAEILFNGGDLGSGIYFYKLEVNNIYKTKKMVIIK